MSFWDTVTARGSPKDALRFPHSITVDRGGTALSAQNVLIDNTPKGREALLQVAGSPAAISEAEGVALICSIDVDLKRYDRFVYDGDQYYVEYVGPPVWGVIDGDTYRLAWATVEQVTS